MNREIKFRGKRIDNVEWVYGDYTDNRFDEPSIWEDGYRIEIDHKTVGQYTGLKDKNDVEIFEGDIVQYTFDNPGSTLATENGLKIRIGKVHWQEWRSSFAVGCKMVNQDLFKYVRNGNRVAIIGNIHDNPELLGGE